MTGVMSGSMSGVMTGAHGELRSVSPADPGDELGRFPIDQPADVDDAVARARAAFPGWRDAGLEARVAVIQRFRDLAAARAEPLARLVAREVGKAIWDARGEAKLVPAKVDVTLGEGLQDVTERAPGPGLRATFHPRGVLAVLGPFNFPAHLPNGHIVPALATGNTVVFKPSELAPAVGAFMAELWQEAGLPSGVFEVVQGLGDTGSALATHPDVDGVLFTGSWPTGRAIQEATLDQPGKILALEMGGKNAVVVLEDADLPLAVSETAISIAATTGQRCSCASRLFVHESIVDDFTERLAGVLSNVRIGMPLDDDVFMGPLASSAGARKVEQYRAMAAEAGGERVLAVDPGRPAPWIGPGLVRFASIAQTHAYQRDEIFGPEAAIYPVRDIDEAIAAVNDSDYGLVASVMTRDRTRYDHSVGRIATGLLNWNRGTIGASGRLPFGGQRRSGNDRPAGISAAIYCTHPQAHVEQEGQAGQEGLAGQEGQEGQEGHKSGFDATKLPPGMPEPEAERRA